MSRRKPHLIALDENNNQKLVATVGDLPAFENMAALREHVLSLPTGEYKIMDLKCTITRGEVSRQTMTIA